MAAVTLAEISGARGKDCVYVRRHVGGLCSWKRALTQDANATLQVAANGGRQLGQVHALQPLACPPTVGRTHQDSGWVPALEHVLAGAAAPALATQDPKLHGYPYAATAIL